MKIEILDDPSAVANRAAAIIAEEARQAVAARGSFVMAVSGGHTPWVMLRDLAVLEMPWQAVHIVQVDERVAPGGHPDRNLTHLRECLIAAPIPAGQIYAMLVESDDLEEAAARYAKTLIKVAGTPPVFDVVHLGLGPDGHTASLVPGDAVLRIDDADVAVTGSYQGRRRVTLTYPAINRARKILWVITGAEKAAMCRKLLAGDPSIPAGRIRRDRALVVADCPAAANSRNLITKDTICASESQQITAGSL
jgi:6-phosphogluconolactonase